MAASYPRKPLEEGDVIYVRSFYHRLAKRRVYAKRGRVIRIVIRRKTR